MIDCFKSALGRVIKETASMAKGDEHGSRPREGRGALGGDRAELQNYNG